MTLLSLTLGSIRRLVKIKRGMTYDRKPQSEQNSGPCERARSRYVIDRPM